jgi:hypothetical protein
MGDREGGLREYEPFGVYSQWVKVAVYGGDNRHLTWEKVIK